MLSNLKKIFSLLPLGDKFKLLILLFMMLLGALLEIAGIGMIPVFVSIVATPDTLLEIERLMPVWETFNIGTSGDLLVYGAILLIIIFFIKNAYVLFYKYTQARFIWRRFVVIGGNLFKQYMYAPYEFHLKRNTSELLRNVTQEARLMALNLMTPFLKMAMDVILIIGIFTMLLWIEPLITFLVLALLGGGGGLFLKLIKEKTNKYGITAQDDRRFMIQSVNEGLGGFKDARILNRERWFYKKFLNHIKSYSKAQTYREVASLANRPVIETIAVTGILLIALIFYLQGRPIDAVIPILTLFGVAIARLMPAIQNTASAITNLRYYIHTIKPVYDDTMELKKKEKQSESEKKERQSEDNVRILNLNDEIRFKEVTYAYPNSEIQAVKQVSLVIPKGHAVGFVGASGAGKTTLVDLLLGLLKPHHGNIYLDNTDIHSDLPTWQRNIGYIPQFIFLADDSIKHNIAFGLPDSEIEEENLQNAIEAAQLSELVESLPNGVDTIIGERGTRLSGGQRQRIGIARALYHNPQVLIMDEATSALDNITERSVIDAIEKLKGERTIIMIAHRLTTVEKCDHLYFMQKGQIKDSGTYDELIGRNSEFKKMALLID